MTEDGILLPSASFLQIHPIPLTNTAHSHTHNRHVQQTLQGITEMVKGCTVHTVRDDKCITVTKWVQQSCGRQHLVRNTLLKPHNTIFF